MNTSKTNPTPNEEKKKRKLQLSSPEDNVEPPDEFVPFLVVEPVDKTETITQSIFAIQKFASCAIGAIKLAKKLRSGSLLLEVRTKGQYDNAMELTRWGDVNVKVSEHRGLNTCRGVVRCRDLRDCSEEDILEALQSQKVTAVRHIHTKKDGKTMPTNTFILTFRQSTPPSHITVAYTRIPVEPFIPNPLRCYKCQKYGHNKATCNRSMACARCGQEGHDDTGCNEPEHCCNCKGNHPAYSKDCPEWKRQRDITCLKFTKNISFAEAKQMFEASSTSSKQKTYAATVKSTNTISIQTDYTWPLSSNTPFILKTTNSTTGTQTTVGSASSSSSTIPTPSTTPPQDTGHSPKSQSTQNKNKNKSSASTSVVSGSKIKPGGPTIVRPPKGSDDPIIQYNKFASLDGMEIDPGPS
jgi:hypothetical protein